MDRDIFSVEDRIVVVTGGAGQLGKQFSSALLERGARVVILDTEKGCEAASSDFSDFLQSGQLLAISSDVTDKRSLELALQTIRKFWGSSPFGLINNAALDSPPNAPVEETGPLEDFPESSWERVMDVNVKGVFLACQVFGREMSNQGEGSIINIGSTYGCVSPDHRIYEYRQEETGQPFFKPVAYSASKSALINFTKYLAVYWAKSNVRANLMALGGVFNHQDEKFLQGYCNRVPMARMAREDEYNGTVIYLMSDASSYMTGATIMLDGGMTAW